MKYIWLLITLLYGCQSSPPAKKQEVVVQKLAQPKEKVYASIEIVADSNITNTSNHKIFVQYNSVDRFLLKNDSVGIHFPTECMVCQSMKIYKGHLLFANQLEIFTEKTSLRDTRLSIDSFRKLKSIDPYFGSLSKKRLFSFSGGKGSITYLKQSCNDADFKKVLLNYNDSGSIKIKNVLDAVFFEYDLDKDGKPEQFILAMRNCSQELAILRIV